MLINSICKLGNGITVVAVDNRFRDRSGEFKIVFISIDMKLLNTLSGLSWLVILSSADGRTSNIEGTQVYRQARSRPPVSEVVFTNEEESLLRGQQNDMVHMLAARLPGKTPLDVQKRCVELGLRCGGGAKPPERNSEKWRTSRRDRA